MQLAIIHQESRFRYNAKAPKDYLLGFIPWGRQSSAYGYAQVMKGTWNWYKKKTGNWRAHRDNFADVVDFIGWYGSMSNTTLGISKWDARNQYLAYHEGHGAINVKPIRGNAGSWRWRKRSSVTRLATEHSWHAVSTTSITRDGFRTSSPTVAMLLEVLPLD
ncbi:hypothetical protein YTPLAS72_23680 [Nitrospira sp.]|nr:hypothetical protein YTPLAS72_23680 [Nitrospira sp.]